MAADRPLRSDAAWSVAGRGGAAIVNLAALAIYSRLLGPAEFGIFALVQASAIILHNGLFHWLEAAILRFVPASRSGGPDPMPALGRGYALAVVSLVALALLSPFVSGISAITIVGPMLLMTLGEAASNGAAEFHRAAGRLRSYAVLVLLRATLSAGGGAILLLLHGQAAHHAVLGHAGGCLAVGLIGMMWRRPRLTARRPALALRDIAGYGWPLSASLVARLAAQRLDRFIVAWLLGLEAAGIYALAFDFVRRAIGVPLAMVNLATYPRMSAAADRGDEAEITRLARLNWRGLALAGLPLAAGLAAISPVLLPVLFGAAFGGNDATAVAALAAAAILLEAARVQHFDLAFMLRRETLPLLAISLVTLAAAAAGCIALAPAFGLPGAATAALLAATIALALSIVLGRRRLVMDAEMSRTVSIGIGALLMGCAVAALGSMLDGLPGALLGIGAGVAIVTIYAIVVPAPGLRELIRKET
ncbi:MAG: lipopolysaccharide biosynthesis protein [Rhodospirillales bacterium]